MRNNLLDAARGLAVLLMLIFHIAVDLEDFFGYGIGYRYGWWSTLRYLIAFIFITVSGYTSGAGLNKQILRNAAKVLGCAFLVSIATWLALGDTYVRFGILHFLGCALLLTPVLQWFGACQLGVFAVACIMLGQYASNAQTATELFLPFGFMPPSFATVDYYPLFPWLSVFTVGFFLGRKTGQMMCHYNLPMLKSLGVLGKHALFIYLLHQPVFMLFLYLCSLANML